MSHDEHRHAATVRRYWAAAEARDWAAFEATLAAGVVYDLPQTRERIRGRETYLEFNRDYPGDWHLEVADVVADETGAVSRASFTVGGEAMEAVTFFGFDADGRVLDIREYWPEPAEPPPGRDHLVERY